MKTLTKPAVSRSWQRANALSKLTGQRPMACRSILAANPAALRHARRAQREGTLCAEALQAAGGSVNGHVAVLTATRQFVRDSGGLAAARTRLEELEAVQL